MLSSLIVCVLVVTAGAMAVNKPAFDAQTVFGFSPKEVNEEPKPCEVPKYFTFDQADFFSTVEEGRLVVEYVNFHGANDYVLDRYSVETFIDFFNGTKIHLKVIADYEEGKEYFITIIGDAIECEVYDIEGKKYPTDFGIPEGATFIGEATVGDRDLETETWYYSNKDNNIHYAKTVTKDECIPVSQFRRTFDPETGEELETLNSNIFNFKLGICDPEKYFKIPEECEEVSVSKVPSKNMQKMRRLRL